MKEKIIAVIKSTYRRTDFCVPFVPMRITRKNGASITEVTR